MVATDELLNVAALLLAGVAGALIVEPLGGAMRLVARRIRTGDDRP